MIDPGLAHGLGELFSGLSVLELGCGSGLAGICAARLGARRVVMTDGDQVSIDLLAKNLEANGLVGGGGGMHEGAVAVEA